ncbi:uncharacterized protein LOC143367221 [Andrena cerasifolii]|uniref:uncharacterized protein LOC143367221 n=1 Tax=Andrena cerasifolii TaxID=2819439 RepID=UPI004037AE52
MRQTFFLWNASRELSAECEPKKVKRTLRRIPATHNFVYDFNPFGNSVLDSNSAATTKGLHNFSTVGQGDFSLKPLSVKQNFCNAQVHSSAALPKLRTGCDSTLDNLEKLGDTTKISKDMNLPNIKKQDVETGQVLARDRTERRKRNPISEIDREVEKVKSDWRTLRTDGGWTRGKNFVTNIRTKQLYDTLEKMTLEIDRIQKSYLDPKSNQYLQRGARKALDVPQSSFEEKADRIKDVLFPKGNFRGKFGTKKMVEISNRGPNDTLRATSPCEMSTKDTNTNSQLELRSLVCNTRARNMKTAIKPGNTLSSNFNKRNTIHLKSGFVNSRRASKEMSSDIEKYLNRYISDADEKFTNNEASNTTDLYSSSDDVVDVLKKFDLHSFDMYDIAEYHDDGKKDCPLQNAKNVGNTSLENSVRAKVNDKTESTEVAKDLTTQTLSPIRDNLLMQKNNALCSSTSIQTNTKSSFKDTTFMEMGLRALNTNIPQNSLSRVLQSEYLKKDKSLKPM